MFDSGSARKRQLVWIVLLALSPLAYFGATALEQRLPHQPRTRSMSREQTIRNRPVPISPSGTTGSPRIVSQPNRSTSKGFIRTSAAGNGQLRLCWSIACEIASRFFASGEATDQV